MIIFVWLFYFSISIVLLQCLNWISESSKGQFCLQLAVCFLLVVKAGVLCCYADTTSRSVFWVCYVLSCSVTVEVIHLSCFYLRICILHVPCSCLTRAYRCARMDMTPVMAWWAQRGPGPGEWQLSRVWHQAVFRSYQESIFVQPGFRCHLQWLYLTSIFPFPLLTLAWLVSSTTCNSYGDFQPRDNFYLSGLHISPIFLTTLSVVLTNIGCAVICSHFLKLTLNSS